MKAYVQKLESRRNKLTLLEHELQKGIVQGVYLGGISGVLRTDQGLSDVVGNISLESSEAQTLNIFPLQPMCAGPLFPTTTMKVHFSR
ncbi:transcription factor TGA10-like [Rutidosis leptorrhynchoides]|uniref:transcription factor TGA10-like n=1 Tax=Rutidosis leptorrhynchoides TaxID=125765 RepID=UPI003A9943E6